MTNPQRPEHISSSPAINSASSSRDERIGRLIELTLSQLIFQILFPNAYPPPLLKSFQILNSPGGEATEHSGLRISRVLIRLLRKVDLKLSPSFGQGSSWFTGANKIHLSQARAHRVRLRGRAHARAAPDRAHSSSSF